MPFWNKSTSSDTGSATGPATPVVNTPVLTIDEQLEQRDFSLLRVFPNSEGGNTTVRLSQTTHNKPTDASRAAHNAEHSAWLEEFQETALPGMRPFRSILDSKTHLEVFIDPPENEVYSYFNPEGEKVTVNWTIEAQGEGDDKDGKPVVAIVREQLDHAVIGRAVVDGEPIGAKTLKWKQIEEVCVYND
jgi:hypothetical protein